MLGRVALYALCLSHAGGGLGAAADDTIAGGGLPRAGRLGLGRQPSPRAARVRAGAGGCRGGVLASLL